MPKGFWDAKRISIESGKRGIPLKVKTVKWAMQHGSIKGVGAELRNPHHRLIVPEKEAMDFIQKKQEQDFLKKMGKKGKVVRLLDLARELGLAERSLHGRNIKTLSDGKTRWVPATEAERLRKKYASKKRIRQKFVSPRAAAREIGVSAHTIKKWIEAGHIPAKRFKINGKEVYRIPLSEWQNLKKSVKEKAGYKAGAAKPKAKRGKKKRKKTVKPKPEPQEQKTFSKRERLEWIRKIHLNRKANKAALERAFEAENMSPEEMAAVAEKAKKYLGIDPKDFKSRFLPRILEELGIR